MGRIQNVPLDKPASRHDKVIGSDVQGFGRTRNYELGDIAALANVLGGRGVFLYEFTFSLADLDTGVSQMSSENGEADANNITTYRFSKEDMYGNDLTDLVTLYETNADSIVLKITNSININLIAVYAIISVTASTAWVDVEVLRFKNFNNLSFEEGKEYTLAFDYVSAAEAAQSTSELINDGEDGTNPFITSFEHDQGTPSTVWTITHNMNRKPSVTVVDTAELVVVGEVEYINENTITITFNSSFSGKAYLN